MGIFRRSGEIVFHEGGSRRRAAVPAWVWVLVTGAAIGAGGLWFVQHKIGPPRLSNAEIAQLVAQRDETVRAMSTAQTRATTAVQSVKDELDKVKTELASTRAALETRNASLLKADSQVARLKSELALFEDVMPLDPRGNPIGVRAARLEATAAGELNYHVLLSRDDKALQTFTGTMQFVVSGERASGTKETVTLGPVQVKLAGYQHLTGSVRLPKGFIARQTAIQVIDGSAGSQLGMRVINVEPAGSRECPSGLAHATRDAQRCNLGMLRVAADTGGLR